MCDYKIPCRHKNTYSSCKILAWSRFGWILLITLAARINQASCHQIWLPQLLKKLRSTRSYEQKDGNKFFSTFFSVFYTCYFIFILFNFFILFHTFSLITKLKHPSLCTLQGIKTTNLLVITLVYAGKSICTLWKKQFVGAATNAAEYAMSWDELLGGRMRGRGSYRKYLTNMFEVTNYRCCLLQKYLCIESREMYLLDANWICNKKNLSNYSQNDWVLHSSGVSHFD